jgi:hypothetical protein
VAKEKEETPSKEDLKNEVSHHSKRLKSAGADKSTSGIVVKKEEVD